MWSAFAALKSHDVLSARSNTFSRSILTVDTTAAVDSGRAASVSRAWPAAGAAVAVAMVTRSVPANASRSLT